MTRDFTQKKINEGGKTSKTKTFKKANIDVVAAEILSITTERADFLVCNLIDTIAVSIAIMMQSNQCAIMSSLSS